ncbi:MAG: hypothetical protein RRZ42_07790 [Oscillospiraceae bacterium]
MKKRTAAVAAALCAALLFCACTEQYSGHKKGRQRVDIMTELMKRRTAQMKMNIISRRVTS